MALEIISGAAFRDVKQLQKSENKPAEINVQDQKMTDSNQAQAITKTTNTNQNGNDQEKGQKDQAAEKQIKNAVSNFNNQMKHARTRCEFSYHEETKRVSIKVIDKDTEEVIREIPPEETLEMVEKMWEVAGLLIDERR
ncbi:MAG: hypothetical protein K0S47_776 [Herbinix sp.]|jgi:flagellar protein FlaG|nr:hypothetical protein [Herbinix sp.]